MSDFKIGDKVYIKYPKEEYPTFGYDRFQVYEVTSFDEPRIEISIYSDVLDYLPKTLDEYNLIPKIHKHNYTVARYLCKLRLE